jgi:chromosome segregation ATPase
MKTTHFAFASLLAVFPVLASCQSSSGHAQADSTAMHMDELRAALTDTKTKVEDSAKALAGVLEKAEADPAPAFEHYKASVSATESAAAQARSQTEALKSQGAGYFQAWEKQAESITDPELKQRAMDRRTKLAAAVESVSTTMAAAGEELDTYIKSLKDMQTYLSNDLTPAGIKSVKDRIKKADDMSEEIGEKIDKVVAALEKGAPEFKTAKPPPPAEPKK